MKKLKILWNICMVSLSVTYVLLFTVGNQVVGISGFGVALDYVGLGISGGILVNMAFSLIKLNSKLKFKMADGILRIDRSNPFKDVYRFELNVDTADITKVKQLSIVVDPFANLGGDVNND